MLPKRRFWKDEQDAMQLLDRLSMVCGPNRVLRISSFVNPMDAVAVLYPIPFVVRETWSSYDVSAEIKTWSHGHVAFSMSM